MDGLFVDGDLVLEGQDVEGQRAAGAQQRGEKGEESRDNG
jgi:hypothetical protein